MGGKPNSVMDYYYGNVLSLAAMQWRKTRYKWEPLLIASLQGQGEDCHQRLHALWRGSGQASDAARDAEELRVRLAKEFALTGRLLQESLLSNLEQFSHDAAQDNATIYTCNGLLVDAEQLEEIIAAGARVYDDRFRAIVRAYLRKNRDIYVGLYLEALDRHAERGPVALWDAWRAIGSRWQDALATLARTVLHELANRIREAACQAL